MPKKQLPPPVEQPAAGAIEVLPPRRGDLYTSAPLNSIGDEVLTSLAVSTPADKARVLQVMSLKALPISDNLGRPIPVRDVLCHKAEGELNGEVTEYIRCVLITPDGTLYALGSTVAFHHLCRLCKAGWYGPPPWEPPLLVEVRQARSKAGLTYYTLTPWCGQ